MATTYEHSRAHKPLALLIGSKEALIKDASTPKDFVLPPPALVRFFRVLYSVFAILEGVTIYAHYRYRNDNESWWPYAGILIQTLEITATIILLFAITIMHRNTLALAHPHSNENMYSFLRFTLVMRCGVNFGVVVAPNGSNIAIIVAAMELCAFAVLWDLSNSRSMSCKEYARYNYFRRVFRMGRAHATDLACTHSRSLIEDFMAPELQNTEQVPAK